MGMFAAAKAATMATAAFGVCMAIVFLVAAAVAAAFVVVAGLPYTAQTVVICFLGWVVVWVIAFINEWSRQ